MARRRGDTTTGYLILILLAIGAILWFVQTYPLVAAALVVGVGALIWAWRRGRRPVVVQATMFDPPTSGRWVEVAGESAYQGSLEIVAGGRNIDGANIPDHQALLVPEPSNPYDPNAVQVRIGGRLVGYLGREDAMAYRPVIDRVMSNGQYVAWRARLKGGWDRGGNRRGSFGVMLALGTPEELDREFNQMRQREAAEHQAPQGA